MTTVFSTGPGMFAANTRKTDDTIPVGKIRILVARIEAYDGPVEFDEAFDAATFKLLPAMAEGNPAVARALIVLHQSLTANLKHFHDEARK